MENRYDRIMKNIEVTPKMHDRILNNINNLDLDRNTKKVIPFPNYRKYFSIAACFVILLVGTVFIHNTINLPSEPPVQMTPGEGIIDYSTAGELSEAMEFTVKEIQDMPFTVATVYYTSFDGDLAQVKYIGQNNTATLRMALGTEDISGDYSKYANITTQAINGHDVIMKGNNGKFRLAVWQYDGFSYSVHFAEGVSEQEMLATIESLR